MITRQTILNELGPGQSESILVVDDQTTEDIIRQIEKKHYKHFYDYDKIAKLFERDTITETCEALYNFCKVNLKYREESVESQNTDSPQKLMQRGITDCKNYALFIGGVLDALVREGKKIRWCYRFVSYRPLVTSPGHVFVVVKRRGKDDIWIDPVLNSFDYHKPYMTGEDLTTELDASEIKADRIGCADCQSAIGADLLQTGGALISASAPALAVIPGAGPFLAVGAQLVGLFTQVFGNNFRTSERVRWLTYLYQQNVLGQNISYSQVDENKTDESHNWFNAVFGVPIYDDLRYHTLTGTSTSNGLKLSPFPSADQRAKQYLQYWDAQQAGVTYEEALAAANIGTNFPPPRGVPGGSLGGWKNLTVSPSYAAKLNAQAAQQGTGTGVLQTLTNAGPGGIPIWIFLAAGGLLLIILTQKKRSK